MADLDASLGELFERRHPGLAAAVADCPPMPLVGPANSTKPRFAQCDRIRVAIDAIGSGDGSIDAPRGADRHGDANAELQSGLWLLVGDLDRSHTISQSLGSTEGSFLHGIMHRREPDYPNAKYWFARVGHHPAAQIASAEIRTDATRTKATGTADGELQRCDAITFVDHVKAACRRDADPVLIQQCQAYQWVQWCELMRVILLK